MADTSNLRSMAREVADLALRLAAIPADGSRQDQQVLSEIEVIAARILKEASKARAGNERTIGETSGMWRVLARP